MKLTQDEIDKILANVHKYPPHKRDQILEIVNTLASRKIAAKRRTSLLDFIMHMDPTYKIGAHHRHLAHLLEDMAFGRKSRVTVSIAPRFGKSQMTSIYFPAWFIGNFPDKKIMMVSHTSDLAIDFGRKVRNLVGSPLYRNVFPDVTLSADSKSAGRWDTAQGGSYFAVGIGGAIAGRGADLLVIDDPHNEQDILSGNLDVFDKAYEWYTTGARTRLMPGGRVAVVATRWSVNDLVGRLIQDMVRNPDADQWDLVEFPAILETDNGQASLWPEQWPLEALLKTKASMPSYQWSAQYQQNPTSEESAIIKREWWQRWEKDEPPKCDYIIMSLDGASEKNNRADFTSITTWGIFYKDNSDGESTANIILLNAIKERMEFPELKKRAYAEYKEWSPDWMVVERKSSGVALYQEMRSAGIPVQEYMPHRGTGDKFVRLNSVADIFASGMVWYPAGRRWAEDVVEEVCGFPSMPNDDQVDSMVMALLRFRTGGFIKLPTDTYDDEDFVPRKAAYY